MTQSIKCPKCSSENVIYSKKRKINFCEDCGYELSHENMVEPLNIFLSYGHDRNEELVRTIKNDLTNRGHNVWFDKSNIKSGHDWRESITDGIIKSNKFLAFLSNHSTRDPGVCLDEIAIAIGAKGGNIQTILVESELEVQAPPSISHIQWLDMHAWKEKKAEGDEIWHDWYHEKLSEILHIIESDESRHFAGEIEKLNRFLKPISMESRITHLLNNQFVGRKWVFDAIEKWRVNPDRSSRLFWITGNPGVGKSMLSANLSHFGRDKIIAAQFCEWDKDDHRNAQKVICSIAFQIATRFPDYRKFLLTLPEIVGLDKKNPAELFDYLLANPLQNIINGGRERYLIVIDALDEASEGGFNPLADMLARNAQRLPDWIGIIVTSRPEREITIPLQGLNPFLLDTDNKDNVNDIRVYLESELEPFLGRHPNPSDIIDKILNRSEGLFLYAEHVCREIQSRCLNINNADKFPQGLGQVFLQYFSRRFPVLNRNSEDNEFALDYYKKYCRPLLELLIAAQRPLESNFLSKIMEIDFYSLNSIIDSFGSFIKKSNKQIRLNHKSLVDWLCDRSKAGNYWVDKLKGHKRLTEEGMKEFHDGLGAMDDYFVKYLPIHCAMAMEWEKLNSLIYSPELDLITRWTSHGDPHTGLICLEGLVSYLLKQNNETSYAAGLITQMARILILLGNYKEAEDQLLKAIEISNDKRISSIAYHELGSIYRYKGNLSTAEKHYQTALNLCLNDNSNADEAAANLVSIASIKLLEYDYKSTNRVISEVLKISSSIDDIPHTVAAYRILATVCKDNLQFDKAEEYLEKASMLSNSHGLPLEIIAIEHLKAWLFYISSVLDGNINMAPAFESFKRVTEQAKKYFYSSYAISAEIGLIWCHLAAYNRESAEEVFDRTVYKITSVSSYDLIIGINFAKAAINHQKGNFEQAGKQYQESINLCKKYNQKPREADSWQGLGSTYWHTGERKEAKKCWRKAQSLSKQCSPTRKRMIQKSIERSRINTQATPL